MAEGLTKRCASCGVVKPHGAFSRSSKAADRLQSWCRECSQASSRQHYRDKPELYRASHLRRQYGLTLEQVAEMLAAQGGACSVCRATEPGGKGTWNVDHDHACCPTRKSCGGCVRGLLCHDCNRHLGIIENGEWMYLAQEYLEFWAARHADR